MRILSNNANFLLVGSYFQRILFFGHNGRYHTHLSFGGCGLPKIFGD